MHKTVHSTCSVNVLPRMELYHVGMLLQYNLRLQAGNQLALSKEREKQYFFSCNLKDWKVLELENVRMHFSAKLERVNFCYKKGKNGIITLSNPHIRDRSSFQQTQNETMLCRN